MTEGVGGPSSADGKILGLEVEHIVSDLKEMKAAQEKWWEKLEAKIDIQVSTCVTCNREVGRVLAVHQERLDKLEAHSNRWDAVNSLGSAVAAILAILLGVKAP